jgi:alcohol dehydrogenase-like protein
MRELVFIRSGRLQWRERDPPSLAAPTDAIVRPILAGRCDGDTLPIHRPVSRALQVGIAARLVDPVVGCICGRMPFAGPFPIGHECVAEIIEVGTEVHDVRAGQRVIVPWAVSCGTCAMCRRGLTSKCTTTTTDGQLLAAYGFGNGTGGWGGMVSDQLSVPSADHMLVPVPRDVPTERVAADLQFAGARATSSSASATDASTSTTNHPSTRPRHRPPPRHPHRRTRRRRRAPTSPRCSPSPPSATSRPPRTPWPKGRKPVHRDLRSRPGRDPARTAQATSATD